jgi:hypothetical protein
MTPGADYYIPPAERMNLTRWLGREGMLALDNMLVLLKIGKRPHREDVTAFARAAHQSGLIDFSDWPEFRARAHHRGAGFPAKKQW